MTDRARDIGPPAPRWYPEPWYEIVNANDVPGFRVMFAGKTVPVLALGYALERWSKKCIGAEGEAPPDRDEEAATVLAVAEMLPPACVNEYVETGRSTSYYCEPRWKGWLEKAAESHWHRTAPEFRLFADLLDVLLRKGLNLYVPDFNGWTFAYWLAGNAKSPNSRFERERVERGQALLRVYERIALRESVEAAAIDEPVARPRKRL